MAWIMAPPQPLSPQRPLQERKSWPLTRGEQEGRGHYHFLKMFMSQNPINRWLLTPSTVLYHNRTTHRLVDSFGSTRRRRQLNAREEGVVRTEKIGSAAALTQVWDNEHRTHAAVPSSSIYPCVLCKCIILTSRPKLPYTPSFSIFLTLCSPVFIFPSLLYLPSHTFLPSAVPHLSPLCHPTPFSPVTVSQVLQKGAKEAEEQGLTRDQV